MVPLAVTIISIPEWGDVSLIEAIWTLVGVATIGLSLSALPAAFYDFALAQSTLHDSRLRYNSTVLLARSYLRREIIRVTVGVTILAVGIYADATPQVFHGVTITQLLITIAFIWIGGSQIVQSFLDARLRTNILNNILQENGHA